MKRFDSDESIQNLLANRHFYEVRYNYQEETGRRLDIEMRPVELNEYSGYKYLLGWNDEKGFIKSFKEVLDPTKFWLPGMEATWTDSIEEAALFEFSSSFRPLKHCGLNLRQLPLKEIMQGGFPAQEFLDSRASVISVK